MIMEDIKTQNSDSIKKANDPAIYKSIVIGLIICMIGTFGRFAYDSTVVSIIAWVFLLIGTWICCKAVFKILAA